VPTVEFAAGDLTFEWDVTKAAANLRKHHVSFEEATTVFLDPHARLYEDPDSDVGEARFLLVGVSAATRMLVVVHVERAAHLRIISAREATRRERRAMEGG
jgi:uncharacterized protein